MYKGVGVGLVGIGAEVLALAGTTMFATSLQVPYVLASHIAQIALCIIETGCNTILAISLLGTIKCAAAHLGSEVSAGNAEDLLGHNMINALLQVGNLLFQPCQQPFGNFAQENTAFAAWVEKARLTGTEQLLWQQVEHSVSQLWRGEDLVAAQICQAIENIGAIFVLHIDKVGCNAMVDNCVLVRQNYTPHPVRQRGCTGDFV